MRSPSNASFRVSARARRMALRVSQPASRRTSLRSRSKQSACTDCRETRDSVPARTTGTGITCRRRSRLTTSRKPSSLLTFKRRELRSRILAVRAWPETQRKESPMIRSAKGSALGRSRKGLTLAAFAAAAALALSACSGGGAQPSRKPAGAAGAAATRAIPSP